MKICNEKFHLEIKVHAWRSMFIGNYSTQLEARIGPAFSRGSVTPDYHPNKFRTKHRIKHSLRVRYFIADMFEKSIH